MPEPYLHIQPVIKTGMLSEDMEKDQGNTNHEAWKRRHNGSIKIQTNKFNTLWREGLGKTFNSQNCASRIYKRSCEPKSIGIYP